MSCPSPSPRPSPGTAVPYLSSHCSLHPPGTRSHSHTPRYPPRVHWEAQKPRGTCPCLCSPKKSKSAVNALATLALQNFPAQAGAPDRSILISCRPLPVYAVAASLISLVQPQIHLTAPQLLCQQDRPTLARRLVQEHPSPPPARPTHLVPSSLPAVVHHADATRRSRQTAHTLWCCFPL